MLDDSEKSFAFEQVKRELRSILLSSKTGVPLKQIKSDYEMLSCNRLPFRDFGFKDVESFMSSMPDVARERRLPDGELVYFAVSDETTAHIQKLISNQKASSKKKRGGKIAFRGRGAFRGGRGTRGRGFGLSIQGGFTSSTHASGPHLPFTSRGRGRGKRGSSGASFLPSGDVRNLINPGWADNSLQDTSHLSSDRSDSEDWDKENQITSPIANLQIGVSNTGERTIFKRPNLPQPSNERMRHVSGESHHSEDSGSNTKENDSFTTDNVRKHYPMRKGYSQLFHEIVTKTIEKNEKEEMKQKANRFPRNIFIGKEVPPRFLRKQENQNYQREDVNSNKPPAGFNDSIQETTVPYETLPPKQNLPEDTWQVPEIPSMTPKLNVTVSDRAPSPSSAFKDIKVKIYTIIGDRGVHLKSLPKLYQKSYDETLDEDVINKLKDWPDLFNVEKQATGRFIVYQVPDALNKFLEADSTAATKENGKDLKNFKVQLPSVGTTFDAMFSFAYSGDEIYLHKAESLEQLYDIDDALAKHCKESPLPDKVHLVEGSLIAANYGGDWYRAQVICQEDDKVSVLFVDYGNKEEVGLSNTRLMPQIDLVNDTLPLAIPCMARRTRQEKWCENVSEILSSISESCLIVEVKHHAGTVCIVDLSLPDGSNVNSLLMRRLSAVVDSPLASSSQPISPQTQAAFQSASPTTKSAPQLSQTAQSPNSKGIFPVKIITEDPEPHSLPDSDSFGAFVCCVMSESSVLLRIVDDEYSDKLDELETCMADQFDQWVKPAEIQLSNVYACILPSEEDEEGGEKEDSNKFYRVRVLEINDKDGTCECFLLDHGGKEIVMKENIRHIDSDLNKSLPYQAIYATLYGLDSLPSDYKVVATKILIRLTVSSNVTFMAIRKDPKHPIDDTIVARVREIVSHLPDIDPPKIAKLYEEKFKEKLHNTEEIIKVIPGLWKHGLEIELIDCVENDDDSSINNTILNLIQEIAHLKASGRDEHQALKDVLGSDSSSQSDTNETGSIGDFSDSGSLEKVEKPASSNIQSSKADTDNSLPCDSSQNSSIPANQLKFPRSCPSIPQYVELILEDFCPIYILHSESPSYFVAMPYGQREELSRLELAMKESLSTSPKAALVFSKSCMYAVKVDNTWRRTLYVGQIECMHEVFYPDYHLYDIVTMDQLYMLPPQFYAMPLMARRMAVGGVIPTSQDWSEAAKYWFIQNTQGKDLYALMLPANTQDPAMINFAKDSSSGKCAHLPSLLYAQLVDTSGEEDIQIDVQLFERGWAKKGYF